MTLIRKRKLTEQQSRRIDAQQTERQTNDAEDTVNGLIVAHYGKQLEVMVLPDGTDINDAQHTLQGDVWRCHTRTNLPLLVTGDKVRFQMDDNTQQGIITALYPRATLLTRPDRYHKVKPVAANVSLIVIMFAPLPVPSTQLIDRYLVACEQANIPCLLVLNKADLLAENDTLIALLAEYSQLGYRTLTIQSDGDLSALQAQLIQQTSVFVGQSGVGKSSVINQLLPEAEQRVNIISENSALGQHTTTSTRLLAFGQGGAIIDSPGIREFGLWHLTVEAIRAGFIEMQPFYGQCKFRNCAHQGEMGCALAEAANTGKISPRRLVSMHRLVDEAKAATNGY